VRRHYSLQRQIDWRDVMMTGIDIGDRFSHYRN
jgi:hypothetical protein